MEGKEEGFVGAATATRVFVGGLGLNVTPSDLEKTFSSLGTVRGVEIVRSNGRSFAYLDFEPASEKALAKLFSTYNGCIWKGGRLKLEKAKEHYLVRLRREWAEDAELRRVAPNDHADKYKCSLEKSKNLSQEQMQLQIFFPRLRKVKSLPYSGTGKHKYSFQRVEVPSLPVHFCDCEEHCGPFETANQKHVSAPDTQHDGINEEELNIMSSVLNKLFEREANVKAVDGGLTSAMEGINYDCSIADVPFDEKEAAQPEDDDNLVTNIVTDGNDKRLVQEWDASQSRLKKFQCPDDDLSLNKPNSQKMQNIRPLYATSSTSNKKARLLPADESNRHKQEAIKPGKERCSIFHSKEPKGFQKAQPIKETTTKSISGLDQSTKGPSWRQKSSWKELVTGETGDNSFSISSILPAIASMQQKLKDSEVVKSAHRTHQNSIKNASIHSTGVSIEALGVVENQEIMGDKVSSDTNVDTLENVQKNRAGFKCKQSILERGFQEAQPIEEIPTESISGRGQSTKGPSWIQKSSWKELVGGETGNSSFRISSILPTVASMQPKLTIPNDSEIVKSAHMKHQNSIKNASIHSTGESTKSLGEVEDQGIMGDKASADANVDTVVNEEKIGAGFESEQSILEKISPNVKGDVFSLNVPVKNDHQEQKTAVAAAGFGVSCTFMRSAASEKEWMKVRSALLKKKGNNVNDKSKSSVGASNDKLGRNAKTRKKQSYSEQN